ncbi:MAG: hypothetical protein GOMPHAMPRED_003136 [Gomphillus americanus]|uniref:Signal recognition particle receptor subunit beta n=1 Tax=Gomphillus americanus TaxID=1940652 RepID=A0A8H3EF35_9LECA|nr:MAG: hypothetical protein GOMPHAMPRED_003136 [Gomphillus americanus]
MSQSTVSAVLTAMLEPKLSVIFSILAIVLILPFVVHFALYRSSTKRSALGIERGDIVQTHTSQAPLTVEAALPLAIEAKSDQYRSEADPNRKVAKRFLLIDTPGHGKLRHFAQDYLSNPKQLKGVMFVVDAADLSPDSSGLRETAECLHDVLLTLQRALVTKSSRAPEVLPFLIAANKADLFTALPAPLVRKSLEKEITSIRISRSKSLFDSSAGIDDAVDSEKDWLGETGEGSFTFDQMQEFNVEVSVGGGSIHGTVKPDIIQYWKWFAQSL